MARIHSGLTAFYRVFPLRNSEAEDNENVLNGLNVPTNLGPHTRMESELSVGMLSALSGLH